MPGRRTAPTRAQAAVAVPYGSDGMPNIQPVGAGDWVRMMLYSYPGWGKTSCIASLAKLYKVLIIRSSMDLVPARALKTGAEEAISDTWESMLSIEEFLRMSDHSYDWVWWDCSSIAQDVLLDDIWAATLIAKPHRASLTPTGGLDKGEYGRNMERIQQWVRHMVGCNRFHFGITAHPFEGPHPTNDEGGDLLKPYIQGKNMSEKICGYCNIVTFLEVIEEKDKQWRRLHFRENSRFYAKDHYDAFLPKGYIDFGEPDLTLVMKAIEKARGRKLGNQTARRGRGTASGRRER